jgi:hypothetical protein
VHQLTCYLCGEEIDPSDLTVREVVKSTRHLTRGSSDGIEQGWEKEEELEKRSFHKECWRRYEGYEPKRGGGCLSRCLSVIARSVLFLVLLCVLFFLVVILTVLYALSSIK